MKRFLLILFLLSLPIITTAYSVELIVNTGNEVINALEATISVPNSVNVEKIYDGNSTILIWINKPTYDRNTETITFSGITPGGFTGKRPVLSFSGDFKKEDLSNFNFSKVTALRNNASGENVSVLFSFEPVDIDEDTIPPEPFEPTISSSPDLFDGARFLSFIAQDKGTGVMGYEYASTWIVSPDEDEWAKTESPKALTFIESFKKIHIRAVDYAGNQRTVSTVGIYRYASILFGIIIILCGFLFLKRSFYSHSSLPY